MMTNKYNGCCVNCKAKLAAGEGFAFNKDGRWQQVCRSTACFRALNLEAPTTSKRELSESGYITMPYDASALPLLRSMPGARWDAPTKRWQVSVQPKDLPRVVELADKLSLSVPSRLREAASAGTPASRAAKERASRDGLYEYQRVGVEFLALHDRALLADEQGTGKTIQTLVALPANARVLVVCPASLKYNWRDEFNKWRPEYKVTIAVGRDGFSVPNEGEVVIINYDILPDWEDGIPVAYKALLSQVHLVADEAHQVKNYKSKRSKKINAISAACKAVWFLTGTPLMNRPQDLFGMLSAGNMNVFGSWTKFTNLFGGYQDKWGGWHFQEPSPEVPERLRRIMLRRLKSEVLKDLPPKQEKIVEVNDLGARFRSSLDKHWDAWSSKNELPPFEEFSGVRAELAKARIPAMMELVESYEDSETPLVVFSAHKAPVQELGKREGWAAITGETPPEERRNIVAKFQGGGLNGVALTIAAGGVGLTLTRASDVLFVDLDWTPAMNLQAVDRLHRIGAKGEAILITYLQSSHPLDQHVQNLIRQKMHIIEKAINETASYQVTPAGVVDATLVEESDEEMQKRVAAVTASINSVKDPLIRKLTAREKVKAIYQREMDKGEGEPPELDDARRGLIRDALAFMDERCDGAASKDGQGFNKADTHIGKWLAATEMEDDDEISFRVAERILSRYHRQLAAFKKIWS